MGKTKHDLKTVLDAIRGEGMWASSSKNKTTTSFGVVETVAQRLNVSRQTIYHYKKRWKTVEDALEEEGLVALDFTFGKLMTEVANGNIAAIIFFLKTKGKEHGFSQRWSHEIERQRLELEQLRNEIRQSASQVSEEDDRLVLDALQIAPSFAGVYRDMNDYRHTEYVLKGGRGSTKSSYASEVIIPMIVNNPDWHALALRQVANTLRDSVYSQIVWAIDYLGLSAKFKTTTSPLEITYKPTGQKIYFRGGDDPMKIKSIKPPFGYINVLWFEEYDQFHGANAIRNIVQSAIRGGDRAIRIASYNPPKSINNWVYKELQVPKETRYIHESDYTTVPVEWLGQSFIEEALYLKEVNPDAYEHEYLGVANAAGGMVFENVIVRDITDEEIYGKPNEEGELVGGFDRIYRGLDFGYYPDPAHYTVCYFNANRRELYIYGEVRAWKTGNKELYKKIEDYGVTPAGFVICDSAEPKSIGDLRSYGMAARGAIKGADSVTYSIKWLQSLRAIIIDNKRCPATADEFLSYEYERTKNDEIISGYPDENNHAIDAVRYATNNIWKRRGH